MDIQKICVCGGGTMGLGIAQLAAAAGYRVVVYEVFEPVREAAAKKLADNLRQLVEKGKMQQEERTAILNNITFSGALADCTADLVMEAVVEDQAIKASLFANLEKLNPPDTILCSNTSSLSIARLAEGLQHPRRFAGLHFFNPATLMKLVEIVKGPSTSDAVMATLQQLARRLGKIAVACSDAPGFIVNRVARPYYIESLRLVEEGICTLDTVDALLESRGFRLGPFKLMDLIGNDVNYAVSCSVYEQLDQPERLKPSPLQQQKVADGALGRKSGKGYYQY